MAYTPAVLVNNTQIPASATVLYTSPALTTTQISQCTLMNTDTSPHQVSIYLPPDASAPSSTALVATINLAAGQSYVVYQVENLIIPPSGTLQAICDSAAAVSINASGVQIQ